MAARKKPAKPDAPAYGITQSELVECRELKEAARLLAARWEISKRSLLERVGNDETIEPGLLVPIVTVSEVHRITADEIARILGVDVLAEIRTQLRSQAQHTLTIVEADDNEAA